MSIKDIILIGFGYIIGSIPTGYLIARQFGNINITRMGSGNIGATNLTRVMGKKYGAMTLAGDGLKALFYMLFIRKVIGFDSNGMINPSDVLLLCIAGLFILIGNCFSVFMKFHGGKGGVTTYGVFMAIAPISSIIAILSYVIIGKVVNISAAGTLASVIVLPVMIYFFYPYPQFRHYFLALAILFAVIVWSRHTKNIKEIIFSG